MWDKKVEPKIRTAEEALSTLKWMCSRQERTRKTCVESMKRWSVDEKFHEEILQALIDEKYLNELRYATMYVNEKVNFYKWGKTKIISNLIMKGVNKETIETAFEDSDYDKSESQEALVELLTKKEPKIKAQNSYQKRQKLAQWAYTRGYSFDLINSALDIILKNDD